MYQDIINKRKYSVCFKYLNCNGLLIQNATAKLSFEPCFSGEVVKHLLFIQEFVGSVPVRGLTYFFFSLFSLKQTLEPSRQSFMPGFLEAPC